jgi:hypothetical protein
LLVKASEMAQRPPRQSFAELQAEVDELFA